MKANGWPVKTLDDALIRTETVNPQERPNAEFEYVDVSSVSNESFEITETQRLKGKDAPSRARRLIRTNDVLFATIRPTLKRIAVVPERLDGQVCSTGYFVMRPKPDLNSRFLFYSLFTETFMDQMEALQTGASYPAVNDSQVRAQLVPIPSLPEQLRIVGILDEAFAGIATAKANAEKNHRNARAIFESHLNSVYTDANNRWQDKTIGEIAKYSLGKMLDKAKNKGTPQPYLRNINVRWFSIDLNDMLEMPFLPEEKDKYTAIKGDVLICEGGYPGRCAIWNEDYPVYFQKALHRVRFHEPKYNKWLIYYLYLLERSGKLRQYFTGSGIQHFTGEALGRLSIPLPALPEATKLISIFDELFAEVQRLESLYQQKLSALDALKKSMLHQAFSGQL